ncbi:hypothetical protein SARC_06442 [Sphaeroforma arctica JP610]|uniref:Uncharacterized protein n=1 Tax=Sphaeroforma arctica JP610 TaxID=667725 RepID=A0A0L0FWL7_9EUKA|nr:hypothetical protein SARC_06442 [Sphaeroforma arctica JP610]KNC81230.1 hypothetical protein SARC_06442 [Sphaeroforma arctica JP610]|eukprot:XP_014155132.1 hypothetical protein SARC_06442 [Sphaeroforma arctica JP610]
MLAYFNRPILTHLNVCVVLQRDTAQSLVDELKKVSADLEKEITAHDETKSKLDEIETQLSEHTQKSTTLQEQYERVAIELAQSSATAKNAGASSDMLSLEMADHVRTAAKLRAQLAENEALVIEMPALKEKLAKKEALLKKASEATKKLKALVKQSRAETVEEREKAKQTADREQQHLDTVNTLQTALDDLKLDLAQALADHAKINNRCEILNETIKRQRREAEDNDRATLDNLEKIKQQLKETTIEFENYKTRAQSVLRQKDLAADTLASAANPAEGSIFNSLGVTSNSEETKTMCSHASPMVFGFRVLGFKGFASLRHGKRNIRCTLTHTKRTH